MKLNAFILVLLFIYSHTVLGQQTTNKIAVIVQTENGKIAGTPNETGDIIAFKGIPFAAPPVGDLRWKAPQSVNKWAGVKDCRVFGASPMQPKPLPFNVYTSEFLIPEQPIDEDCLYLNVWTSSKPAGKNLPVFVWIYGGGFNSGGAGVPIYDGEAMAKRGVVFVTFNYRVGIFGFFVHPDLKKESPYNSSGNYGLMDQIAALQWIQKNIAAFGGDPGNVTIAGQSAGSMSVNCLTASPLTKGLFHKAIAESGATLLPPTTTIDNEELKGIRVTEALGVASLHDMRTISANDLQEKVKERFIPVVDGYVLPQSVATIFAENKQADVPLLTGWNADEAFVQIKSKDEFRKDAEQKYGNKVSTFLSHYPAETDEQAAASQVALGRDRVFALSNYRWAEFQSHGKNPAYVYYFTRRPPATEAFVKYKAFHTAEVAYALDNLRFVKRAWQPVDFTLAKIMSSYWINFAKTGNPNGKDLPVWPRYTSEKNSVMILKEVPESGILPGKSSLDFLYTAILEENKK
jgi:para-nitrobenzyl esterase